MVWGILFGWKESLALRTHAPTRASRRSSLWRALPFALATALVTSAGLLPPVGCGGPSEGDLRITDADGDGGSAGTGGGSTSTVARPYTVEMFIETANLTLLSVETKDPEVMSTPEPNGEPALLWMIKDSAGNTVDAGIVADPRVTHAEPMVDGEPSIQDRVPSALLRVDTQVNTGTLTVVEQSPTGMSFRSNGCEGGNEVGSVELDGATGSGAAGSTGTNPEAAKIPGLRKIIDHGECAYNVNLLIIPDGFTSTQMAQFRQQAQTFANKLKTFGGFEEGWEQVNVWTLEVASKDSGISDPDNNITKNTAFGVAFGTGANRRCVFPRNITSAAASLRSKAERAVHSNSTVIIANSTEHGGCASGPLSATTIGSHGPYVFAHELGHSLFNLGDEYTEQWRCKISRAGNRINTTKNRTNPPWKSLVNSVVEGAEYCEKGVYRAQSTCLMRSLTSNFCTVCRDGGKRWFENRKLTHPDAECSQATPPEVNCMGGEPCASGTVCSWNGEEIGYCCRAPFEGTETCYTDDECDNGQVCAFGGPPNNYFYCTKPDQGACVE